MSFLSQRTKQLISYKPQALDFRFWTVDFLTFDFRLLNLLTFGLFDFYYSCIAFCQ